MEDCIQNMWPTPIYYWPLHDQLVLVYVVKRLSALRLRQSWRSRVSITNDANSRLNTDNFVAYGCQLPDCLSNLLLDRGRLVVEQSSKDVDSLHQLFSKLRLL